MTSSVFRVIIIVLTVILFNACKKEIIDDTDKFVQHADELSALQPFVASAGLNFIEVEWGEVFNSHYKSVVYSVFLNDEKIVDKLTNTKYSLINLEPNKEYKIKIIASTADGQKIEQSIDGRTLDDTSRKYIEYKIHPYSRMIGAVDVKKLKGGGHLVSRFISSPTYFNGEAEKIVVFRVDGNGLMLWYRLLSTMALKANSGNNLLLAVLDEEVDPILVIGTFALKINLESGEINASKDFSEYLAGELFRSIYATSQQIIISETNGGLMSVNPRSLSVNWYHVNTTQIGDIGPINVDSEKNIYCVFRERNRVTSDVTVHKYNSQGQFLTSFSFAGYVPDIYHNGFNMGAFLIDSEDKLYLMGYSYRDRYLQYFKFDKKGTVLRQSNDAIYLVASSAFFNNNGDIAIVGKSGNWNYSEQISVFIYDKNFNVKSTHIYTDIPDKSTKVMTENIDGSYNLFLDYVENGELKFGFTKIENNEKI